MNKLHRRRCLEFAIVAAAMALIAVSPAGALAAGEESATRSTPGETTAAPSGSTESAAPTPPDASPAASAPSTGWIPQSEGTETSDKTSPPTRRGSSLGSGSNPSQTRSTSEEPSHATDSSGSYEPESPTPSTFEEPASTPAVESTPNAGTGSPEPPAAKVTTDRSASAALGTAVPVALSKSSHGDSAGSSLPAAAASLTNRGDEVSSGSGPLPLLALIVFGLIVLYAGGRLVMGGPLEPLRR